ncbi:MAG: hypothetical protein KCHDKBKB_02577 [Elusimicrobia bacterium]|nr:hypothetical protein [Elusimicrobiota bacterium]
MINSQFHVNLHRKQMIIVAPACRLAGAQVLYLQNLFHYGLKKQNLGPGQEACRGDVQFGCGESAL